MNNGSSNSSLNYSDLACVILAAGTSTRLRPLTDEKPKCLLEVGGRSLLERTIGNVLTAGIKEVHVVIGYRAEMVRQFIEHRFPGQQIHFILNPNYATTENAYSLLLALRYLKSNDGRLNHNLLLLDSDILFSKKLLPFILSDSIMDKIAIRVIGEHNEEEIRVKTDGSNNIILIGKETPLLETYGESIGIEIFSVTTTVRLFEILNQRMRSIKRRCEFYEATFQEMINNGIKLRAIDVSNFSVIEIDTTEDLRLAQQMIGI